MRPLGLALDPDAVGLLTEQTYYYEVTAVMPGNIQSLPSEELSTTPDNNGGVRINWGDVVGANSYRIYRGTSAGGESQYYTSNTADFFDDGATPFAGSAAPPTATTVTAIETTIPLSVDASAAVVQAALVELPVIGTDANGNPNVTVTGGGGTTTSSSRRRPPVSRSRRSSATSSSLRSNGLHAIMTLDGGSGDDTYDVNTIGGRTNSLVNVFDSGGDSGDSLTINGTDFADVFLMRAATASNGLAFVALINGPTPLTPSAGDPVERINYNNNLEGRHHRQRRRRRRPVLHRRHARPDHDQRRRGRRLLPDRPAVPLAPHACTGRRREPRTSSPRSTRRRAG